MGRTTVRQTYCPAYRFKPSSVKHQPRYDDFFRDGHPFGHVAPLNDFQCKFTRTHGNFHIFETISYILTVLTNILRYLSPACMIV